MKLSIVIPHWPKSEHLNQLLTRCVNSLNDYTEIIVAANQGIGFAKAVNMGLHLTHGDYIIVANNDTQLIKGNLADMCIPNTVTSPVANGKEYAFYAGFFCMPRNVYEAVGDFDEQFGLGYFEDDDYRLRIASLEFPVQTVHSVEVQHDCGATFKTLDATMTKNLLDQNEVKYLKKWSEYLGIDLVAFKASGKDFNELKTKENGF